MDQTVAPEEKLNVPSPSQVSLFDADTTALFGNLGPPGPTGPSLIAPTRTRVSHLRRKPGGIWTAEEDFQIIALVSQQANPDWSILSAHFPDKTANQLMDRWRKVLNPTLVKGNWTSDEDRRIIEWVATHGTTSWTQLAKIMPGRIGKQVRERYHNSLDPALKKGEWTHEEDALVLQLHEKWGNKWAKIAELIPGRTDNAIKNRWNATLRKGKTNITLPTSTTELPTSPVFKNNDHVRIPDLFGANS
jgi:hypothetical protein